MSVAGAVKEAPAIDVGPQDLPVCCPNAAMPLWSSHPRVFLALAETGEATCPYCGTRYALRGGPHRDGQH